MNAGTSNGCASEHLEAVQVATPDGLRWVRASELSLGYRQCQLPKGAVLTRARCRVTRGTEQEVLDDQRAAKADVEKRRNTQPLSMPNSGSVFVNPRGDFAGRLIEKAGLKGTRRGGAQISDRHANFIVNLGEATAQDVVELISLARSAVRTMSGVELTPEVRLVGTFEPPLPRELEPFHQNAVLVRRSP
jgi:UDP-N-acetylmuramate dehydrogenase